MYNVNSTAFKKLFMKHSVLSDKLDSDDKHYIDAFNKLEDKGKNTFNIAAAIFGIIWMLYRRMYVSAATLSIINILLSTIFASAIIHPQENRMLSAIVFIGIILLHIIIFGIFGNKIYLWELKKKYQRKIAEPATSIGYVIDYCILYVILKLIIVYFDGHLPSLANEASLISQIVIDITIMIACLVKAKILKLV